MSTAEGSYVTITTRIKYMCNFYIACGCVKIVSNPARDDDVPRSHVLDSVKCVCVCVCWATVLIGEGEEGCPRTKYVSIDFR